MRLTYKAQDQHGKETGSVWYASAAGNSIFPKSAKEEQALKKLAAYEDAEEQGRLVILPCKVGTPVWSSVLCGFDEDGHEQPAQWPFVISMMDEWGTGFFMTKEEAEAALKGEKQDV